MAENSKILRERYRLIKEISRGGMGAVFLAEDLLAGKLVAVKRSFFSGQMQAQKGFELEAKLLARLDHSGLPKVLDYFTTRKNVQTLVMDFVVGDTLEDILESGKFRVGCALDYKKVLLWTLQILDILRYLHNFEPPVVHRDIKPNNIKLTKEGKIVLLDFGLAKGSSVTVIGGMSGYSPIEQVQHTGTDPRSDLYALGTSLFHLLANRHPYTALERFRKIYGQNTSEKKIAFQIAPDPQESVAEINPQVPKIISEIVMKAMALMPEDRFQTADEMKSAILKAQKELDLSKTQNFIQQTAFDAVNDWEKAKPIIDENEVGLGGWVEESKIETEENDRQVSPISFIPSKIGENSFDFANNPTSIEDQNKNDESFSAEASNSKTKSEITRASFVDNLRQTVASAENNAEFEPLIIEKNNLPNKKHSKIFHIFLGGLALILLLSLAGLAWYLRTTWKTSQIESVRANVSADSSPKEIEEKREKLLEIKKYGISKDNKLLHLDKNYQFAVLEEFKFGINSPKDGFLYVVSRDSNENALRTFPRPEQKDNFIKQNTEKIFPQDQKFRLNENSPAETWVYFVIVPAREDDLAKRILATLDGKKDKKLSETGVRELFADLDNLAENPAETIVEIIKLQKK